MNENVFSDEQGNTYRLFIDFGTTERLRRVGFDVGKLHEHLEELENCGRLLFVVLWELCREQVPKGTTAADFQATLRGDVLGAAREALYTAVLDFFPPKTRELWAKAIEGGRAKQRAEIEKLISANDVTGSEDF